MPRCRRCGNFFDFESEGYCPFCGPPNKIKSGLYPARTTSQDKYSEITTEKAWTEMKDWPKSGPTYWRADESKKSK